MFGIILSLVLAPLKAAPVQLQARPGLWAIDATVETMGMKLNPNDQMKIMMATATEEQKKKMAEDFKKMGLSPDGSKACYTKETLNPQKMIEAQQKSKCTFKSTVETAKKIAGTYSCEGGHRGDIRWESSSETEFSGTITSTDPRVMKIVVETKGKFLSEDCGDLKAQ